MMSPEEYEDRIDKGLAIDGVLYGQRINLSGGRHIEVSGYATHREAVEEVVRIARQGGWQPRLKWWQFWLPKAPSTEVIAEFHRQAHQLFESERY